MDIQKFKELLEIRLNKRLLHTSFEELTVGGSLMRFQMEMAIVGYPFELSQDQDPEDYKPLLTDKEFFSRHYDQAVIDIFNKYYDLSDL